MLYCLRCIMYMFYVVEWVMVAVVMLLGVSRGTSISSYYNGELTWGKLQEPWFIMGPPPCPIHLFLFPESVNMLEQKNETFPVFLLFISFRVHEICTEM